MHCLHIIKMSLHLRKISRQLCVQNYVSRVLNKKVFIYRFMATDNKKRRLITSFHNLTVEQQAEVKALYPLGFTEVMTRYDKPDGTFFYTVPYETEDTYYMVKIDVKVDDGQDDDNDSYYDDDDLKGADELAEASEEASDDDF